MAVPWHICALLKCPQPDAAVPPCLQRDTVTPLLEEAPGWLVLR